ncbi:MAG: tetratricopeptide repeat protein [Planctomycetota bacterium]
MQHFTRWTIGAAALTVAMASLSGCMRGKTHQEWVDNAENRWQDLRSAHMVPMARQALESGDLDRAEGILIEASSIDPDNPQLFVLAGRVQFERGKLERAYHLFNQAAEFAEQAETNFPDAHYYQGIVLQRWSKADEAAEAYQRAYDAAPDDVSYLTAWAEALVSAGRRSEAKQLLASKMEYFDQSSAVRIAAGHLHAIDGEHDRAIEYFREASLLSPDDDTIAEELALALFASGRDREAAIALETLTSMPAGKQRADLHRVLAQAYARAGHQADARATYLKLTRLEPDVAAHWIVLGNMALEQGKVRDALSASRRATRIEPLNFQGFMLAGLALSQASQFDDAATQFGRAAELAPADAAPLILRGIALQKAGKTNAAAAAYREALRRSPNDSRATRLLQSLVATP